MTTTLLYTKIAENDARARITGWARSFAKRAHGRNLRRPAGEINSGDVLEAASKEERWNDLELEQVSGDAPLR